MAASEEWEQKGRRPLTIDHHGIRVGGLDALNEGIKHRPTGTHHALGWVHNALDGVLDIGRRKGGAVVPLYALVEVEGDRFAAVTHLPGIGEFGHDLLAFGIVGTGTNKAV